MPNDEKLKPCPFCGSDNIKMYTGQYKATDYMKTIFYRVECDDCK